MLRQPAQSDVTICVAEMGQSSQKSQKKGSFEESQRPANLTSSLHGRQASSPTGSFWTCFLQNLRLAKCVFEVHHRHTFLEQQDEFSLVLPHSG